ncbi:MAG: glycine zipper family protein [Paracoccaceae bacterium]
MRPILLAALPIAALLSGCETTGANYVPVIDGAVGPNYQADLAACQQLARTQPALDDSAALNTVAGAGAAAATTAIIDNSGTNVLDAAIIGAAAGLTGSALQQQANKQQIVINCMRGRGYNVIG